ncbi:30S ribosomal protein S9 [Crocinitomicaceae bacterium]|jgi:small subunit ribosomal protein S9|nr:30S ribosomal protein S9 [Flavobacteriales bacterium]MDA7761566.1 30S ribosomal protein S9 [Crocinitomicaceae bacterium]MBT5932743.1 30S ribosomal protein S9 [Flavobacteriales bacterium]MDA9161611.1 30S ribosomal protein S9 [Crocinitomicaceae bacterium]MDB3904932.1 30S ribosomal protein S9 [Crocinitomicaceae bacterium]
MQVINTLGRRKTAVARVYLSKGKGKITVNNKEAKEVFPIDVLQSKLVQPFVLTDTVGKYNVSVNVSGGGINGQVEAIRLGISRALVEIDAENRVALKVDGLMTRDPRMVERKKPGQPKARKKFQFSKR